MPEQDKNRGNANQQQSNLTDAERRRRAGQGDEDVQGQTPQREQPAGRDTGEEAIDQNEAGMEIGDGKPRRDNAGQGRQGGQGGQNQPQRTNRDEAGGGRSPGSANTERNRGGQEE